MAFERRTWLARIGQGLNKFLIGEKDAQGRQTLTNSPDSVTQEGDVISADNLNDLEGRIEEGLNDLETQTQTALGEKVDVTDLNDVIEGMKLTKVWENPNPTSTFSAQTISFAEAEEIIIVYTMTDIPITSSRGYCHIKGISGASTSGNSLSRIVVTSESFTVSARSVRVAISGGNTQVTFEDSRIFSIQTPASPQMLITTANARLVPLVIYSVGDIYNS